MSKTAYYKRLVLDLCDSYRAADTDLQVLGLVAEDSTVVLRLRVAGVEQVEFFEGRDGAVTSQSLVRATQAPPG